MPGRLAFVAWALIASSPSIPLGSSPRPVIIDRQRASPVTLEDAVFELVNSHRRSLRLPSLVAEERIRTLAREHSKYLASGNAPLSHEGFEARIGALGLPYVRAAENAASNRGFADPAAAAVSRWISSPDHRRNIEGDFDLTGVGVARSETGTYYFTQIFVKRSDHPDVVK